MAAKDWNASHQPCQDNRILKITGLLDHSLVTFLLDSGAAVSVICLSAHKQDCKTAPIGFNGECS